MGKKKNKEPCDMGVFRDYSVWDKTVCTNDLVHSYQLTDDRAGVKQGASDSVLCLSALRVLRLPCVQ